MFPVRKHLLLFAFFLIACDPDDSNSHGKLNHVPKKRQTRTQTQPAAYAPCLCTPWQTHNCIPCSRLMLMHPGWKWQDIVEGQSFNEPLRDQSWWLTISLQLIRQGNRGPQCFTPSHHPPPHPLLPALHKQTNYSNGYKLDPFPENAPSTFFLPFLTQFPSACPPCELYAHTSTRMHTGMHAYA